MTKEKFELLMRIVGTACLGFQLYAYGPSIGIAITHGLLAYCIWLNRERP